MLRVLTILGTRPEAVKLAPVLHEFERDGDTFESLVAVTGQHREMLDPMLDLFGIRPHYDLDLMTHQQSLSDITLAALRGLQPILEELRPDWVLLQGDTTSVMAACIASFYGKVKLGHVEAGLRTFDKYSPFPEEINRRIAGVLADLHFAPTPWARANLLREGVPEPHVRMTGNTVIDAMSHVRKLGFDPRGSQLGEIPLDKRLVLVTAHRNENLGQRMEEIALGIRDLARLRPDVHFLYPMHLNPRARQSALRHLGILQNVSLVEPLGYREMVWALHRAHLVLTDSGGLQEEAAGAGTPVLVLRDTTERPEGIEAGIARLVGPDRTKLLEAAGCLLSDEREYQRMTSVPCPYGDGRAASRIVDTLAGRPTSLHSTDHIYERPLPEHPLDALLREATAGLPRRYAKQVMYRAREKAREMPVTTSG